MATKKLEIKGFVNFLGEQLKEKAGYIMGSRGQNPRSGYLDLSVPESKCRSSWKTTGWYFTQYSGKQRDKALYWRKTCKRVFDCQGLVEGYIELQTGQDVNTYARHNYGKWCGTKGTGMIPAKYRMPGAAVFWGNSASSIHHVAYLYKPVKENEPTGDYWLIEARGVNYGVVKTKLSERKPNYWGIMEKYFDYTKEEKKESVPEPNYQLGDRALKEGMVGADVKVLQEALNSIGYNLTVDGVYGKATADAVITFKTLHDIFTSSGDVNSIYGSRAHEMLMKIISDNEEPTEEMTPIAKKYVSVIKAGSWNVRKGPGTEYSIVTIVKNGALLPYISTASNGWMQVEINDTTGWLSPKCAEVIL